ncbi:MAG: dipeptidyl aminopeptidase/acylaminoacyl peptidase [Cognaticolwellia sp.]|jgi:dipeptidyl aminopeptidase/acylaminoacyl peptidase
MKQLITFSFLILFLTTLSAQDKKALSHEVYDDWKSVTSSQISNDGKWVLYNITPQEGDRILQIYNIGNQEFKTFERAKSPAFSHDNKFVVFKRFHPLDRIKILKRKETKKGEMPKDTLGVYSLSNQKLIQIPNIKSYQLPKKAGGFLAYQTEPVKLKKSKKSKKNDKSKEEPKKIKSKKKVKKESEENGYHLIVRNLLNNIEDTLKFVTEYEFTEDGKSLAYLTTGIDSTDYDAGIYIYNTENRGISAAFYNPNGAKKLTWDDAGEKLAWIADTDTSKAHESALIKPYDLFYWNNIKENISILSIGFDLPKDWMINENSGLYFSDNGSKLFFGTAPKPIEPDTITLKEDRAVVDIWSWTDGRLQPQQLSNLSRDKKKTYKAVYHFKQKKYVQLETLEVPASRSTSNGESKYIVGFADTKYQKLTSWVGFPNQNDVYIINTETGKRKQIATQVRGNVKISPSGKYLSWYEKNDSSWYVFSIENEKLFNLNNTVSVNFYDEENDVPDEPYAYGAAGWTENDKAFLVYDAYDIWSFEIKKNEAVAICLTKGRAANIKFRNVQLDYESSFLPNELLLKAFDKITKAAGFYSFNLKKSTTEKLIMEDYAFNRPTKAKNANQIIFTKETFQIFPDLYTSNLNFRNTIKVSDVNPQMSEYKWGTVEMTSWTNLDGVELKGLIYKPENFDSNKKYPMLVYFYEKYSDRIHRHYTPRPLRSAVNFTYLTSNDYVVFIPDIIYKDGFPGESAYNCILPGVQHVINQGYVNKERIGIQGHSWGGYQTAYLVTRTNLFRAAESGAPVSNMTSAYGGIRWTSGLSRMFQYERTQSRIGGTLWEKPMLYLENSPVFHANKIETPLLILHNDGDGAVPWYQGIELFVAMRRLDKPSWLLNYNGDGHGVTKRPNQEDFAIRMYQFFDHYLKDEPAPEWMIKGVPAVEKGLNDGLELIKED